MKKTTETHKHTSSCSHSNTTSVPKAKPKKELPTNRSVNIEDMSLYTNPFKHKFFWIKTPSTIPNRFLGISLLFTVRFLGIIYVLRSVQGITAYLSSPSNQSLSNACLNIISIITFLLLYLSIYMKKFIAASMVYYSYTFHFFIKLLMSIHMFIGKLLQFEHVFNVIVGAGLGLLVGSLLNFFCAWVMFCFMVYTHNIDEGELYKRH